MLRDQGRKAAEDFYAAQNEHIGKRSTLDLDDFIDGV
jgi:hypothetical protein